MITHKCCSPKRRHRDDDIQPTVAGSLWRTLQADVARFREEGDDTRTLVRGILSQGFQALVVYRIFRWFHEHGIPTQPLRFVVERLTEIITGISIPVQAQIGKGLRIHHFGGIIIHSETVIGEGCTLYHGVTLGDRGGWGGAPRIGNRVMIGAGAKILGNVSVGDDCRIGANAVVTTSVPSRSIAVGVPAVIKELVNAGDRSH
jgi:serine O-acetyltransferase